MAEIDRVRWHCRRGLLELDLYAQLAPEQKQALARLLDLPDNDLWDLVTGRASISDEACAEIVGMLR